MLLYIMCLWIWPKTSISNVAVKLLCVLFLDAWCKHMKYYYVLMKWLLNYYVTVKLLMKLRGVTSPMDCKGDNIQVSFQSIHPNK